MSDDATPTPLVGQTFRVVEIGGAPALDAPTAYEFAKRGKS